MGVLKVFPSNKRIRHIHIVLFFFESNKKLLWAIFDHWAICFTCLPHNRYLQIVVDNRQCKSWQRYTWLLTLAGHWPGSRCKMPTSPKITNHFKFFYSESTFSFKQRVSSAFSTFLLTDGGCLMMMNSFSFIIWSSWIIFSVLV